MSENNVNDFELFERHLHENFSSSLVAFSMRRSPGFAQRVALRIFAAAEFVPTTIAVKSVEREYQIGDPSHSAPLRIDLVISGECDHKPFVVAVEAKKNARHHDHSK
jgi:hypothetical protein